ncbi:MAG: substrate-binding domain-containing protein [Oscillospiraceae bacterium]|nr:substrate-binding domain-containing protein [Oscillospiraceae bacterium]
MKTRKILLFLLAAILILSGCGGNSNKNKVKVGVLFASYTESPRQEALLAALEDCGYMGIPMNANQDQTAQKTQLSSLAYQKYPLVIIEPVAVENAGELAEILKEAQIPGIFIGQEPEEAVLDSWDKLFYVGVDETRQGYLQGQILLDSMDSGDINGDEVISYAIIRGPEGDPEADLITKHCDEALRDGELECSLLTTRVSDGTKENGKQLTRELLSQHGKDVEVLLCNSDALALGAIQAVLAGGWTPGEDIYIVGVGGTEEVLEQIENGTCIGTVISAESGRAQQITKIAKALLDGEEAQKRFYADYQAITKENLAIFYGE